METMGTGNGAERFGVPDLPPTRANIAAFLRTELARVLELNAAEIDPGRPITRYALDSVQVGRVLGILQRWTGRPIDPELLWDYPTIDLIAEFLGAPIQE